MVTMQKCILKNIKICIFKRGQNVGTVYLNKVLYKILKLGVIKWKEKCKHQIIRLRIL